MKNAWLKLAIVVGTVAGLGAGGITAAHAQSWPNQCYNNDGGISCPVCGQTCLGGQYLCCNNSPQGT